MKSKEVQDMEKLSLELLEWPELCKQLAGFAMGSRGAWLCSTLVPYESESEAAQELALTSEMVIFQKNHGFLPIWGSADMDPIFSKAQRGERLLGQELAQVREFLGSVAGVRKALIKEQEVHPGLWGIAQALDDVPWLAEAIDQAIDKEGNVMDRASTRLGFLRKELRQRREALHRRLEDLLRRKDASGFLQDNYYTIRENRFVLPVRAEARAKLGGIVHDISSSGATCFLEPPWLVELNNDLRVAQLEVEKELERILSALSSSVGQCTESLRVDQEVLARLDMIQARARLSAALEGSEPSPSGNGEMVLKGLRHPLLALRSKDVVPNDLVMEAQDKVVVISGPNAGGKTVLLKALGLAALMAKSGLHVPVDRGSRMPFFKKIFADIGDQQDTHQDFSTFSAHMRNLREILRRASEGSMVLLDELAGSTDPQEGSALALAVLEKLMEKGALVVASTHYPQVKAWAQGRPGALNAAMEFDWETLTPTYKMRQGIPGESSALEVARKMELPEEVLEAASRRLRGDEMRLEALLREMQQQRKALEQERDKLQVARARWEELAAEREKLVRSLKEEREAFLREKRRRLSAEIQEARERIKQLLAEISGSPTRKKLQHGRMQLEELAAGLRSQVLSAPEKILPLGEAKPGDRVHVIPLGQQGILMDDPSLAKGKVRVLVGRMEVWVDTDSLGGTEAPESQQVDAVSGISSVVGTAPVVESPSQLDLRGRRTEDALEELAQYLDRALLGPMPQVRIIHGHGTGALKSAVRKWLSQCSWISGFRPGTRGEGGDGVTVVSLRGPDPGQESETQEPVEHGWQNTNRRAMDE